jgi:hypothetical protein
MNLSIFRNGEIDQGNEKDRMKKTVAQRVCASPRCRRGQDIADVDRFRPDRRSSSGDVSAPRLVSPLVTSLHSRLEHLSGRACF